MNFLIIKRLKDVYQVVISILKKLDIDVRRKLKLDIELDGKGNEKIIIPSNIIDIYTRLETLIGLKLSGLTDTITEAKHLIDELYRMGDIQNEQQYRNAPNKNCTWLMGLPSKLLEQLAFNTRPQIEENILVVMDQGTQVEHLPQPLRTNHKQFEIAVSFLAAYNGIINVAKSNNNFYFAKSITDEDIFWSNFCTAWCL